MCGITGYLTLDSDRRFHNPNNIVRMTDAIIHRGPDSDGHWYDVEAGVALGMRRLAIIDLSPAGRQPMVSVDGRYVIVFNGEIYNYRHIRDELERQGRAPAWRGHSDTEVLLAAVSAWGLVDALKACNGMFALALWDCQTRTLQLSIDRFGEKPLYFGWMGRTFLFGSELKTLMSHPAWAGEIDRDALALFLRFSYVPAPHCIFQGIRKMEPGSIAILSFEEIRQTNRDPQIEDYWSARNAVIAAKQSPLAIGESEAISEFESRLSTAVKLRMVSDVPLGAFLSGGFDSSAIVAMMQKLSSVPVRTFSIGFTEPAYNEAPFAKAVAQHLGTDHTELYVTPREAMEVIPKLPSIYDEPFADSSQIPTYLVAQMARRHVTVALSGDAGDELLGGYARYFISNSVLPTITKFPLALRRLAAVGIESVGVDGWDRIYRTLSLGSRRGLIGDRALKFAKLLALPSLLEGYRSVVSNCPNPAGLVRGANDSKTTLDDNAALPDGLSFVEQMMFLDTVTYLPGDILTKLDRATMAVSLEGRIPFLDPELFNFAWQLSQNYKVRGGTGKWLLRQIVYRHIPKEMMDRPKTGFGIPMKDWLRGPLKEWANALLQPAILRDEGLVAEPLMTAWQEHQAGTRNWQHLLWPVLMFLAWKNSYTASQATL